MVIIRSMSAFPTRGRRAAAGLGVALLGVGLLIGGCRQPGPSDIGDADRGALLIGQHQCGSCHVIPGVAQADGMAGPPLAHFARRTMIAGLIANTPAGLVGWLRAPQAAVPGNAMPDMGLNQQQARDVAAYLYSLR